MITHIIEDTRNKISKNTHIREYFDKQGIQLIRTKMLVGDFTLPTKQDVCIDLKKDIQELIGDLTSQRERFKRELQLSKQCNIKLIILIENDLGITCLEEIPQKWENPLTKKYKNEFIWKLRKKGIKCTSEQDVWAIYKMCKENGIQTRRPPCSEEQLMKSMITCQKNEEYSVSFEFCSKAETGKRILELLTRQ